MRIVDVARDGYAAAVQILKRTALQTDVQKQEIVRQIVADVRSRGDDALLELGRKYDSPVLDCLLVSDSEWDRACEAVDAVSRDAIDTAAANIRAFHERQLRASWMETGDGTILGQLIRPLRRVGLYVPGGTAVYPSTVLMTAIPAKVAGVEEVIVCTPAGKDGNIKSLVLFAARKAGVQAVYKVGGAQAIAAMAYGTATIGAVDKIAGPGNTYVNIAKKELWGVVDIDMLAGPSEVCVVADDQANPAFVAADMLTQAEHDIESAAYLITTSAEIARNVSAELETQLERLPRKEILRQALKDNGAIVIAESLVQAIDLANECAPEHLALMVREPFAALGSIKNAGAVLMGDYSPQTLGDYLAGPSHTLPTSGTARFASPLNVDSFMKKSSYICYTREALAFVAPTLTHFARSEGFEAHAAAVDIRGMTHESPSHKPWARRPGGEG